LKRHLLPGKSTFFYCFIGSLGGNLLSAVIAPYDFGVGASTSLFAAIGALFVWFYANYSAGGMGIIQFQYMVFFAIMIGVTLMNGIMMDQMLTRGDILEALLLE